VELVDDGDEEERVSMCQTLGFAAFGKKREAHGTDAHVDGQSLPTAEEVSDALHNSRPDTEVQGPESKRLKGNDPP
jgi:hypothetical protein